MPTIKQQSIIKQSRPRVVTDQLLDFDVFRGLLDQADAFGWQLLSLALTQGRIPQGPPPIGAVLRCYPSHPIVSELRRLGCPIVFFPEHQIFEVDNISQVLPDLYTAGELAAEHLVSRNFRHLAYIGQEPLAGAAALFGGFKSKATALGCNLNFLGLSAALPELDPSIDVPENERLEMQRAKRTENRDKAIGDWLESLPKPLGILGYHSWMGGRLLTICHERGLRVPEDVAIVAKSSDPRINELTPVPLTSIDMNNKLLGREAMLLLSRLISGKAESENTIFVPPKGIIERQSTNILAVADDRVSQAIRYMWENLHEPLSDEDVARETKVSLRTLRYLFKKHLGRSINAELRRKRLETAKVLIQSTELSISEITEAVGFSSKSYLHKLFRREFGKSPGNFRT